MKTIRTFAFVLLALLANHTASAANWGIVSSPNAGAGANLLLGVASAADNDVWAVGSDYNAQLPAYRTLVEHWNGTSWSIVRSPNATNSNNFFNGVAVVAANDVWAVGWAINHKIYNTLVEHWNGTAWSVVPSPNVGGDWNLLQGVCVVSATDIWAVGTYLSNSINHPLTLHWDGTVWSVVASPSVNDDVLLGVAAISSNDVWAVGRSQNEAVTLTMHWDGSAWSVVPSPNQFPGDNVLLGVAAVSSSDVWAVGAAGTLATLAIHWDGSTWSIVPTPAFVYPKNNGVLAGVVALSSTNIWTAGQFLQGSLQQMLTENWNGSKWSFVASPNNNNFSRTLNGIAATPNGTLWAVGTSDVQTLILRRSP